MTTALASEGSGVSSVDAADFREALDAALRELDADERCGPLLGAARLRLRFEFPDLPMALSVASGEAGSGGLSWRFSEEVDWRPRLELRMDSAVANAYLQGRKSLAVALARGEVKVRGDSRAALLYLPMLRFVAEPYARVVEERFPRLAAA